MNKEQKDRFVALKIARTTLVGCEYRAYGSSHESILKSGVSRGWNAVGNPEEFKAASLASLIYVGRAACGLAIEPDLWEDLRGIGGFPAKNAPSGATNNWLSKPHTKVDILDLLDQAMKAIQGNAEPDLPIPVVA